MKSQFRIGLIVLIILIIGVLVAVGFILFSRKESAPTGLYKFSVNSRLFECHYFYGLAGTKFNVAPEIINTGSVAVTPPVSIWLLYDNKVCDQKDLDRLYKPNEILFRDRPDNRTLNSWFGCSMELPPVPQDAEKINKVFSFVYTVGNQNPLKEGVTIFSGYTKEFCGVAVE